MLSQTQASSCGPGACFALWPAQSQSQLSISDSQAALHTLPRSDHIFLLKACNSTTQHLESNQRLTQVHRPNMIWPLPSFPSPIMLPSLLHSKFLEHTLLRFPGL